MASPCMNRHTKSKNLKRVLSHFLKLSYAYGSLEPFISFYKTNHSKHILSLLKLNIKIKVIFKTCFVQCLALVESMFCSNNQSEYTALRKDSKKI